MAVGCCTELEATYGARVVASGDECERRRRCSWPNPAGKAYAARIRTPTVEQLDEAVVHLNYEVSTLVHQALVLRVVDHQIAVAALAPLIAERSGWSVLPILDQMAGSSLDSLIESTLLHLRLVDAFLGGKSGEHDVVAADLADEWIPQPFLAPDDVRLIDAQLTRFLGRRDRSVEWPITTMTMAMVGRFESFLDAVPPDRWSQLAGADIACQMARVALG